MFGVKISIASLMVRPTRKPSIRQYHDNGPQHSNKTHSYHGCSDDVLLDNSLRLPTCVVRATP